MKEDGKIIIIITHDYEFIKMAQENVIKFINDTKDIKVGG